MLLTDYVRSMFCDNSASQTHVSLVTVLHLHPCYTELLPPRSPSSKTFLGKEVIAVKLLQRSIYRPTAMLLLEHLAK